LIEVPAPMISPPISTDQVAKTSEARLRLGLSGELWTVLAALTALYVVGVLVANRRFVWFDELFTFDLARAQSLPQMWMLIRKFDFQLPTGYVLSRVSMKFFGANKLGLRFPSMLEFYVGSMALFFYVRRKVGIIYAAAALLILWMGETFRYATEARPYALLFMCFSILLLSWDVATTSESRAVALWCVALANLGMFSAHVFAPFSLMPFLAAEAVRFSRTRKADFALWIALLLPVGAIAFYIPLFRGYSTIYFPPLYEASLARAPRFIYSTISAESVALLAAVSAALIAREEEIRRTPAYKWRREDLVLFSSFVLNPVLLNLLLIQRHGAFWDRYVITTQAANYIGAATLLGIRLRCKRSAGYAAAAVLLLIFVFKAAVSPMLAPPPPQNFAELGSIRPDLPLVDAGGVTFFEMNHHENADILSRLFFLKDRTLAMKYTHTNLFEDRGFGDGMKPYFPIFAHVTSYAGFIKQHREFVVLGEYGAPEEWLLRKLSDDGAQLTWLGAYPVPYLDANLYLVKLPAAN
jgi:hypothetical protein